MKKNRGFTIVELLVSLSIISLLGILGIPFARSIIISGKVDPTANDINKVVTKLRTNMSGSGTTPYTNLGATTAATAVFANTGRGLATALTIKGAGATAEVSHDLGKTDAPVTVAQANLGTMGDSFSVSVPDVNEAACPGLATQLNKAAEVITVNGTVVKANGDTYNGATAQNACVSGDSNTFVFTFR